MSTVPPPKHHQPLHNFSLPFLKWGQRVHLTPHHRRRHRHHHHTSPTDSSDSDHHNRKPKTHQNAVVLPNKETVKITDAADVVTPDDGDVKPWNLRPRRNMMIDTVDGNGNGNGNGDLKSENQKENLKKQRRLWISLSKEEIEEDVYAFTGSKPVRRPKKRNRTSQKHVDNVFPGLYLVGLSADSYRV